jgi:hypothetical protein
MGIIANAMMKGAIALTVGARRFRWQAGASFAAIAAAAGMMLLI